MITPTVNKAALRASIEGAVAGHAAMLAAPVRIPAQFDIRKFNATTLHQGMSQGPIRIPVIPVFDKEAFNKLTLKEGISGAGDPKIPVSPTVDKDHMQQSMDTRLSKSRSTASPST